MATASAASSGIEPLLVHSRRGYWAVRGLGALAFTLACAWAAVSSGGLALGIGLAGCLMFGFFTVYALRQLLRRGPRLRLSSAGFEAADLGIGWVLWHDVAEVQAFGSAEAPFVVFVVPRASAYMQRMPWHSRAMARWLRLSGLPMFSIDLIGVDQEADAVARHAERLRQAATTQP